MNSRYKLLGALLLAGWFQCAMAQVTVVFSSSMTAGGLGLNSENSSWSTSGGFIFEVGVFTAGFTPSAVNETNWASSWTIAAGGSNTGTATWIDDGGATYFQGAGQYDNNTAPLAVGTQLYIWGFDSRSALPSSQWILLTNTSWLVQSVGSLATDFIDTTDTGTYAVVGSVTNGGVDMKSAVVGSTIPEPATYAAFFGATSLGMVFWCKRRRAV
jgi:hypothetical protein